MVGALWFVAGAILIGALGIGSWYLRATQTVVDEETNCPIGGPTAINVVVVDRSDPISGQQAQRFVQEVQAMKQQATFGERFDIYTFEGNSEDRLDPLLTICSPRKPETANEIIENPEFIAKRYEERFAAVLDHVVEELTAASERPASPIMESVKAAAQTSYGSQQRGRIPLRLLLVSDMIQHTDAVSHYRAEPDFPALEADQRWSILRPDLKGAEVKVLYLLRPTAIRSGNPIQNRGHQLFWEGYVAAGMGHLTAIEPF